MNDAQLEEILARATLVRDQLNGFIESLEGAAFPRVEAGQIRAGWEVRLGDYWVTVLNAGPVAADIDDETTPYYVRLEFEDPHGGKVYPVTEPVIAREFQS